MPFSKNWNNLYKKNKHISVWPWSDLVSLIMKFKNINKKSIKVLELGCGAGANIPFFYNYRCDYYAIEGSDVMVKKLKKKYKKYKNFIICDDFTKNIPFEIKFDLIIDRGSITHNKTDDIINVLNNIHKKLKNDGLFIGSDWFSTKFSEFLNGKKLDDKYTRFDFKKGRLKNTGIAHFSDLKHIKKLFKDYNLLHLEHKEKKKYLINNKDIFAAWDIVAKKKKLKL